MFGDMQVTPGNVHDTNFLKTLVKLLVDGENCALVIGDIYCKGATKLVLIFLQYLT